MFINQLTLLFIFPYFHQWRPITPSITTGNKLYWTVISYEISNQYINLITSNIHYSIKCKLHWKLISHWFLAMFSIQRAVNFSIPQLIKVVGAALYIHNNLQAFLTNAGNFSRTNSELLLKCYTDNLALPLVSFPSRS